MSRHLQFVSCSYCPCWLNVHSQCSKCGVNLLCLCVRKNPSTIRLFWIGVKTRATVTESMCIVVAGWTLGRCAKSRFFLFISILCCALTIIIIELMIVFRVVRAAWAKNCHVTSARHALLLLYCWLFLSTVDSSLNSPLKWCICPSELYALIDACWNVGRVEEAKAWRSLCRNRWECRIWLSRCWMAPTAGIDNPVIPIPNPSLVSRFGSSLWLS